MTDDQQLQVNMEEEIRLHNKGKSMNKYKGFNVPYQRKKAEKTIDERMRICCGNSLTCSAIECKDCLFDFNGTLEQKQAFLEWEKEQ